MDTLLIGDHEHREFVAACAWLGEQTRLRCVWDVEQASAHLGESPEPPGIVVFAQSRPGQFSAREVERLHAAAPLARLVALLGSWCEGETRSGRPWPGVMRIYWHEWLPRLATLLAYSPTRVGTNWNLPRTATDAEWLLATSQPTHLKPRGLAVVSARRHTTFAALADACQIGGIAAAWLSPETPLAVQGANVALWDSAGWGEFEAAELATFTSRLAPVPVIALLDFPRLQEREQVLSAGAVAVVSKPFLIDDLLWQFDQVLGMADRKARIEEAA